MAIYINSSNQIFKANNRMFEVDFEEESKLFFTRCAEESELSLSQKNIVDLLCKRLKGVKSASKSTSTFARAIKIFLRIGGTEFKCHLDFKNPYGVGFTKEGSGSLLYADNGVTATTTACMNTQIIPSVDMLVNSAAIVVTPKINASLLNIFGCQNASGGTDANLVLHLRTTSNGTGCAMWRTLGTPQTTQSSIPGVYVMGRTGVTTGGVYVIKNNSVLMSGNSAGGRPSFKIYEGGLNIADTTTTFLAANQRFGCSIYFSDLTQSEAFQVSAIVQDFETALGR